MRSLLALVPALFAGGCFLASPSSAPLDAGATDASIVLRVDAGRPDGGPEADAGPPGDDAGCAAAPVCVGEVLRSCDGDRDCAAEGSYCDSGGAPACRARACAPGVSRCISATIAGHCDERGVSERSESCEVGCDAGRCLGPIPCPEPTTAAFTNIGDATVDLCGAGDDFEFTGGGDDCGATEDTDQDRLFRWDVTEARSYVLAAFDVDNQRSVDPVLYVRRGCNDPVEIVCSDDRGAGSGNGLNPYIERHFEVGTYWIVLDSFDDCGFARLLVRTL